MVLAVQADDLAGQRFGKLTAVQFYGKAEDNKNLWLCRCDCGNEKVARAASLKSGSTKSCGCLFADGRKKSSKEIGRPKLAFL